MKDEQILKAAIEKACKKGYDLQEKLDAAKITLESYCSLVINDYRAVVFFHDFAKAFWGDENCCDEFPDKMWQFHLQQMVLKEDPIQYLKQFLK